MPKNKKSKLNEFEQAAFLELTNSAGWSTLKAWIERDIEKAKNTLTIIDYGSKSGIAYAAEMKGRVRALKNLMDSVEEVAKKSDI